jgi:hypothetical protein
MREWAALTRAAAGLPPVKNAALYSRVLGWISEQETGQRITERKLREYAWYQGVWHQAPGRRMTAGAPAGPTCCIGAAALLLSGYRFRDRSDSNMISLLPRWWQPSWYGNLIRTAGTVLGLTPYEARLMFHGGITRPQLEAVRPCFEANLPVTAAALGPAAASRDVTVRPRSDRLACLPAEQDIGWPPVPDERMAIH